MRGLSAVPPPPPPPPPPAPAPEPFRARPVAPGYAQDGLAVPPADMLGLRRTINSNLSEAQMIWNLRSAYNVAALNCLTADHALLADRYGAFLSTHARELAATNRALDKQFKEEHGRESKSIRDRYMTQVYNYFALPPALPRFCEAAVTMSSTVALAEPGKLNEAAALALPQLEAVFLKFFDDYDSYRREAAQWEAEYLATYGEPYRRPGYLLGQGFNLPAATGTSAVGEMNGAAATQPLGAQAPLTSGAAPMPGAVPGAMPMPGAPMPEASMSGSVSTPDATSAPSATPMPYPTPIPNPTPIPDPTSIDGASPLPMAAPAFPATPVPAAMPNSGTQPAPGAASMPNAGTAAIPSPTPAPSPEPGA